jgi:hypothetical protein
LYYSPYIIRVIKYKKDNISAEFGTYGEKSNAHRVSVGRPERNNHLEDPGIDKRIILNRIIKRYDGCGLY